MDPSVWYGTLPANPERSRFIVERLAQYVVYLRHNGHEIRERRGAPLKVIAFVEGGVLRCEIGLRRHRSYRSVLLRPGRGSHRYPRIRPRQRVRLDASELPRFLHPLREVFARELDRCHDRYKKSSGTGMSRRFRYLQCRKELHYRTSLTLSDAEVIRSYRKRSHLRGFRFSVDTEDAAFIEFFCGLEREGNPYLADRLWRFAVILTKILQSEKTVAKWVTRKETRRRRCRRPAYAPKAVEALRQIWSNGFCDNRILLRRSDLLARLLRARRPEDAKHRQIISDERGALLLDFLRVEGHLDPDTRWEVEQLLREGERRPNEQTGGLWRAFAVMHVPLETNRRFRFESFQIDWLNPGGGI